MPDYVDRELLLSEAKRLSGPITGDGWDNYGVYSLIERQPSVDLIKVVRCMDCEHWTRFIAPEDGNGYCNFGLVRAESDFCSKALRRAAND